MTPLGWAFIGLVALTFSVLALAGPAVITDPEQADLLAIIAGVAATVAWGSWSYLAFSLRVGAPDGSGTVIQSYPSVALLGVALAMPGAFVALTGPLEVARPERARDIET